MMFATPPLEGIDLEVIKGIDDLRTRLRYYLREPRRWKGQLRRNLKARAIQGSNSIEGYDVTLDDALALLDDEEPLDADRRTVLEVTGYRNAMTYVQQLAGDDLFKLDESLLRSLHFMMLGHDLTKSPGQYRAGPMFVYDEERALQVYEAPDSGLLAQLMAELVASLEPDDDCPIYVRGAMAHLNLVMIHPFRDGNGRMARCLQTLVLAREKILSPEFSSIEEWLGRNTLAYYDILAQVGAGGWHPGRNAAPWIRFNLRAHHMQAQTVLRRVDESGRLWLQLIDLAARLGLPDERVVFALYEAALGLRVKRATYATNADLEAGTASRDLRLMVAAGLLEPRGQTKGRFYVGTITLREERSLVIADRPSIVDPYVELAQSA